jgi:hypothetical protein
VVLNRTILLLRKELDVVKEQYRAEKVLRQAAEESHGI